MINRMHNFLPIIFSSYYRELIVLWIKNGIYETVLIFNCLILKQSDFFRACIAFYKNRKIANKNTNHTKNSHYKIRNPHKITQNSNKRTTNPHTSDFVSGFIEGFPS